MTTLHDKNGDGESSNETGSGKSSMLQDVEDAQSIRSRSGIQDEMNDAFSVESNAKSTEHDHSVIDVSKSPGASERSRSYSSSEKSDSSEESDSSDSGSSSDDSNSSSGSDRKRKKEGKANDLENKDEDNRSKFSDTTPSGKVLEQIAYTTEEQDKISMTNELSTGEAVEIGTTPSLSEGHDQIHQNSSSQQHDERTSIIETDKPMTTESQEVSNSQGCPSSILGDVTGNEGQSCKRSDEDDPRYNEQSRRILDGAFGPPSKSDAPIISSSDEAIVNNDLELHDFESLLQYNPSAAKPSITLPVGHNLGNQDINDVEDLLLDSTPISTHLNPILDTGDPNGTTPIQAHALDHSVQNGHDDIPAGENDNPELSHLEDQSQELFVPPSRSDNNGLPIQEFSQGEQLSVFSDATSGKNYLRHVSNAKKQLKLIENEINELRGVTTSFDGKTNDNSSRSSRNVKNEMILSENNRYSKPRNKSKLLEEVKPMRRKDRRIEPTTSAPDDNNSKGRHKSAKKKQVHPNKESRTDRRDPSGRATRRSGNKNKERKKDVSPSTSARFVPNNNLPTQRDTTKSKRQRGVSDPPMVLRGNLEVEGSPIDWNGDHLSLGMTMSRDTKDLDNISSDASQLRTSSDDHIESFPRDYEMSVNSVSPSRIDRGDDDEELSKQSFGGQQDIDDVPRHVDTNKTKHDNQHDPWDEVPFSCCCRYLPHTLVVATTHAYRLDRADQKDLEFSNLQQ